MGNLLTLYKFKKRRNSTQLPSGASASGNVNLKVGTSLSNPTFEMAAGSGDMNAVLTSNYAQFLNQYYWIDDIRIISSTQVEIICTLDGLATARDDIMSTKAYCLYADEGNSEIPDNRLSVRTSASVKTATTAFPFNMESESYILSVIGDNSIDNFVLGSGGLATISAMFQKMDTWFTDAIDSIDPPVEYPYGGAIPDNLEAFGKNLGEIVQYLGKVVWEGVKQGVSVGSAMDNVKSCIMLPFGTAQLGSWKEICLGAYKTGIQAQTVGTARQATGVTVPIPWQSGDWTRRSPYTELYMSIPFIGVVQLSPESLITDSSLSVIIELNWLSGCLAVDVVGLPSVRHIGRYTANCAGSVSIGASNISPVSVANSVVGGVAAGLAAGGVSGLASAAVSLSNSLVPQGSAISGNSGGTGGYDTIGCYCIYHGVTESPSSVQGTVGSPVCGVRTLGSISGYVQTQGASVETSKLRGADLQTVNSTLDGGVFIE